MKPAKNPKGASKSEGRLWQAASHAHDQAAARCAQCGRRLSRSDANDYGTLCMRCYMREYG